MTQAVILLSSTFLQTEVTRFVTPDYVLLGFHQQAFIGFEDMVPPSTLVFDLDELPEARQLVRDLVGGTLAANQMVEQLHLLRSTGSSPLA